MTIKEIRSDLQEIRYYYSRKETFDKAAESVVKNSVIEKVMKYNVLMAKASPRLFDLYIALYVQNETQIILANKWNVSVGYIKSLNKQLCEYLLSCIK